MVQQVVDSKGGEHGVSNAESNVSGCDKQPTVTVKKTALRDVQNENRMSNSAVNASFTKDKAQVVDSSVVKVAGIKRPPPKDSVSSPQPHQSLSGNAANAQIVYVRRKSEVEIGKSGVCDGKSINADSANLGPLETVEEVAQPKALVKEGTINSFLAYTPISGPSSMTASANPSAALPVGNSSSRFPSAEINYHHVASAVPLLNNHEKGMKNLHWEERFHQLQILLNKLDESDQEDYVQMLRSLSSVELSRHAVDLEKRSIQLSLEEVKEVQRARVLNVLGKVMDTAKVPATSQAEPMK